MKGTQSVIILFTLVIYSFLGRDVMSSPLLVVVCELSTMTSPRSLNSDYRHSLLYSLFLNYDTTVTKNKVALQMGH